MTNNFFQKILFLVFFISLCYFLYKREIPNSFKSKFYFENNLASLKWISDSSIEVHNSINLKEISLVFSFKNVGKETLYVNNISTTCGCTSLKFSSKEVLPSDTCKIFTKIRTYGKVDKTILNINFTANTNLKKHVISIVYYK